MAILESEKLTAIEEKLNLLKEQVKVLENEHYNERQTIFCKEEGLVAGETLITCDGKVYLFSHLDRKVTSGTFIGRGGTRYTPDVHGYQILSSGKPSDALKRIYLPWEKVQ